LRLTSRLILLALIALLPAIAVQAYNAVELRRDREAEVHDLALDQAYLAASEIDRILEGVRSLLVAVSTAASIRELDPARCVPYLAALLPRMPHLVSIAATDSTGLIRCRQELPKEPTFLTDRAYFNPAMQGGDFVVGEYTISRISNRAVLPLAVPLRDSAGTTIGVVVADLDLNWFTRNIAERGLAPGGSVTVADRNGVIIAREPDADRFIGTRIPDAFMHLVNATEPGSTELTSLDGTRRVLGYVPVSFRPAGLYVSTGLSASAAFAGVREATLRSAVLLLSGVVAALAAAMIAGRLFIKRPVDRLLRVVAAWQAGDLSVRTGFSRRFGEFGQIGEEMDRAAGEAERREAALRESEERYRALVHASAAIEWRSDADGSLLEAPLWAEYTGQPVEAHRGWGWLEMVHPDDRAETERVWEEAHTTGTPVDIEYRVFHAASGQYRWVRESGVPLRDPDGSIREWVGAVTDIHERRQGEERQKLLLNELNHRVKNTLAIVQAIVFQTMRSAASPAEALHRVQARLMALSGRHDLLNATSWAGASLRELIEAELAPYRGREGGRTLLEGAHVELDAKTALALGLVVHELATNAAKYGALSAPDGRVEVRWRVSERDAEPRLQIDWVEREGPPVTQPDAIGFGTRLIERSVTGELSGEVECDYSPTGLRCRLNVPLGPSAQRSDQAAA
jgi:PAS domain S-box-containing protein